MHLCFLQLSLSNEAVQLLGAPVAFDDITSDAVNLAIAEFDRIGRAAFLDKYEVGAARGYYVIHNKKRYDAKALLAAAHGFTKANAPLPARQFAGGAYTVARFEKLGFEVITPKDAAKDFIPFEVERVYHRQRDIHQVFGGQERGGICTPKDLPFLFLFTGESGAQYGYLDKWSDDGSFEYVGEGASGDMEFVRGNKAIRDHALNGKDLLLFEAEPKKGTYRYLGCFGCSGYETQSGKDVKGNDRTILVFKLVRVDSVEQPDDAELPAPFAADIVVLRKAAYAAVQSTPNPKAGSRRNFYMRAAAIKNYVLARAKGICEACDKPAPFIRANGTPYLEPHHTLRLSDGGPDHPRWVGAICPTCHRHIHHGQAGTELNDQLKLRLQAIEPEPPTSIET